jgi:hypothetical protein
MSGQWTLCCLDEPSRVPNQKSRRWIIRSVQHIEQSLHILEALGRMIVTVACPEWSRGVPYSQAELLEFAQNDRGIQALRVEQPPVASRPPIVFPVMTRAKHQLDRVEITGVTVLERLVPIGDMSGC